MTARITIECRECDEVWKSPPLLGNVLASVTMYRDEASNWGWRSERGVLTTTDYCPNCVAPIFGGAA